MTERSHLRLVFWLVLFFVVYVTVAWTVDDYSVCVSSQTVDIGQAPVVKPMVCE